MNSTSIQNKLNQLLHILPTAVQNEKTVVTWISNYAELNCCHDINPHIQEVTPLLKTAKATSSEATYIIKQALSNLEEGMPIHPSIIKYCQKYAA